MQLCTIIQCCVLKNLPKWVSLCLKWELISDNEVKNKILLSLWIRLIFLTPLADIYCFKHKPRLIIQHKSILFMCLFYFQTFTVRLPPDVRMWMNEQTNRLRMWCNMSASRCSSSDWPSTETDDPTGIINRIL